jgi:hypothetical protein
MNSIFLHPAGTIEFLKSWWIKHASLEENLFELFLPGDVFIF